MITQQRAEFCLSLTRDAWRPQEVQAWEQCPEPFETPKLTLVAEESTRQCLSGQPCHFKGAQIASGQKPCSGCGSSPSKSRCSRCQQERLDQILAQTRSEQLVSARNLKNECTRAVLAAEAPRTTSREKMLKAGYAHLCLGRLFHHIFKSGAFLYDDDTWDEGQESLTKAAALAMKADDWLLENQAWRILVTTRPASDQSNLGASAVYQLLDRSRIKNDTISSQLAMIEWGILNTDTGVLCAGYATRAMKQIYDIGLTMLRAASHRLSTSIMAVCKVIETCSLADSFSLRDPGDARMLQAAKISCLKVNCPHEMLHVLQEQHARCSVKLYVAIMSKGDVLTADAMMSDMARSQEKISPQLQAQAQARIANVLEVQKASSLHARAAKARSQLSAWLTTTQGQALPGICSICLSDLPWDKTAGTDHSIIILPDCFHGFHLECLGEWRMDEDAYKSRSCPLCNTPSRVCDEMTYANAHILGKDSKAGRRVALMDEAGMKTGTELITELLGPEDGPVAAQMLGEEM